MLVIGINNFIVNLQKKAMEAHNQLARLGPCVEIPLYNQPSDTPNFKEAMRRHALFKDRLVLHLRKKAQERHDHEKKVATMYSQLNSEWNRKVEKVGSNRTQHRHGTFIYL